MPLLQIYKAYLLDATLHHGYAQSIMENTTDPSKKLDSSASEVNETTPVQTTNEPTEPITPTPVQPAETEVVAPDTSSISSSTTATTSPTSEVVGEAAPDASAPTVDAPTDIPTPPANEPDNSPVVTTPTPVDTSNPKRPLLKTASLVIIGLVILAGVAAGSYLLGKHRAKPATTTTAKTAAMTVPAGATIIEKCEPGLGTQYVLPKDIPGGPVYNVYQGKVIGIEYMTSITTVDKLDTMLENLPLYNQKYDHINVMSMPAHSGFPTPHYQVDVMMVPAATAKKITCGSSSSSMSSSNSSSNSMSSSSSSTKTKM